SAAPAASSAKANASAPQAHVPSASAWTEVTFPEMKLVYRRPPLLAEGQSMIAGAQAGKAGDQVWGMAVKTTAGLDLVLLELKIGSPERAKWLADFKADTSPGEVVFADGDAVVKRARVVGTKTGDAPVLSTTHVDMRACKRLGESEYCFDIDGAVELALGRPGLDPASAMELVALVRSLERPAAKK
ncbi:MAG: hypothetical protein JNK04_18195, partial [Myxococcales bacterium]|nr:hypothetical protein [Myxococcales bacterium]